MHTPISFRDVQMHTVHIVQWYKGSVISTMVWQQTRRTVLVDLSCKSLTIEVECMGIVVSDGLENDR